MSFQLCYFYSLYTCILYFMNNTNSCIDLQFVFSIIHFNRRENISHLINYEMITDLLCSKLQVTFRHYTFNSRTDTWFVVNNTIGIGMRVLNIWCRNNRLIDHIHRRIVHSYTLRSCEKRAESICGIIEKRKMYGFDLTFHWTMGLMSAHVWRDLT